MVRLMVVTSFVLVFLFIPLCSAGGYQSTTLSIPAQSVIPVIYGEDISRTIYESVSYSNFQSSVIDLTEFGPRWSEYDDEYTSQENKLARAWIANELQTLSNNRIEVEILSTHKSVIGRLPGYILDGPVIMVGGHYDSMPGSPGANDDASGVAATLELARVFSRYNWPLDIYFCAWNSEEIGFLGSHEAAIEFKARGIDILTYYNVDMLLVEDPNAPGGERVLMAHTFDSQRFAELTTVIGTNYGRNVILPITEGEAGGVWARSDHYSFYSEGYENVLFAYESGGHLDTAYHTPEDRWDNPLYNYTVAYLAVAQIGASIAHTLSRAYHEPVRNEISSMLMPSDKREFKFVVGAGTDFVTYLSWYGGTFEAELFSPTGSILATFAAEDNSYGKILIMNESMPSGGLCTLVLSSESSTEINYNLEVEYDTDFDRDNIPDSEQFWFTEASFENDYDEDGLSDALEYIIGTDVSSPDTDSDSMPDKWEYENGLNPTVHDSQRDSDDDSLTNVQEYEFGTDPQNSDSDSDLLPDAWEVNSGTDPLVSDANLDPDADGLTNIQEFDYGTLPFSNDTDNDQIPDLWEIQNGLDPTFDDTFRDYDFDDLNCYEEYIYGTNPHLNDSDGDLMPDNWEVMHGLNPLVDDSSEDSDGDKITNLEEYYQGSDPNIPLFDISPLLIIGSLSMVVVITIVVARFVLKPNSVV